MKNQALEIVKDIFTNLLILVCIVFAFAIFFYDDIALTKVIPELEEYTLTSKMQNELREEELDQTKEVIINYYIDGSDLKKYEKTNEYDKGKSNPFGEYNPEEVVDNNSSSVNTNNNSDSENFYEDDGTK